MSFYKESRRHQESVDTIGAAAAGASVPRTHCATPIATPLTMEHIQGYKRIPVPNLVAATSSPGQARDRKIKEKNLAPLPPPPALSLSSPVSQ
jgi:hypothetical protein